MLLLVFQIGAARYALDTSAILEVVPRVALKPLLRAPLGVVGLLDYHAAPVPVLDLCEMATGQPSETRFSTRLILVQSPAVADEAGRPRVVGLLAERATTLIQRQPSDFSETGLPLSDAPYAGPVTTDADGFIHRVRVEEFFNEPVRALLEKTEVRLP